MSIDRISKDEWRKTARLYKVHYREEYIGSVIARDTEEARFEAQKRLTNIKRKAFVVTDHGKLYGDN